MQKITGKYGTFFDKISLLDPIDFRPFSRQSLVVKMSSLSCFLNHFIYIRNQTIKGNYLYRVNILGIFQQVLGRDNTARYFSVVVYVMLNNCYIECMIVCNNALI